MSVHAGDQVAQRAAMRRINAKELHRCSLLLQYTQVISPYYLGDVGGQGSAPGLERLYQHQPAARDGTLRVCALLSIAVRGASQRDRGGAAVVAVDKFVPAANKKCD